MFEKMGSICSYLCCCCLQNQKENKRELRSRQKKNLKLLKDITESNPSSKMKAMDSPLEVKTTDISDRYMVPTDRFPTESDVFKKIGYRLGDQIDSGGFAVVHTAVHIKKGLKVACKKMSIPEDIDKASKKKRISLLTDIKNELYVLQKIEDHPNVVKMITHFVIVWKTTNQMTFYIIMQFASGGNLSNKLDDLGPFTERQCKRWFAQILSGLNYMHSKKIAHRDLKLANILLDEAEDVLISDFGLSRLVWRQSTGTTLLSRTYCGTPPYMAPEVLDIPTKRQETHDYEYNARTADIWSCGVILFKLFNKRYPFSFVRGPARAVRLMKAKKWQFAKVREQPSEELRQIMDKMLQPKPDSRISMKDLITHSWIKKQFNSVEEKNSKKMSKKS